jgi:hypothetical protein
MPYPATELNGQRLRGKLPAGDERYEKGLKLYTGMIGERPHENRDSPQGACTSSAPAAVASGHQ